MNYEEKYKEALERASKLKVQNPFDTVGQMVEHIFSELKESEEERIKKALIKILNEIVINTNYKELGIDYNIRDMIAWLEKQGEQTRAKLGQSEVTKTSDQESPDKVEPKDAHPDIDVRTMAAWQCGYKEAIEKACEWLDENMNDVGIRFMRGDEIKDIVDLFRKEMKGE